MKRAIVIRAMTLALAGSSAVAAAATLSPPMQIVGMEIDETNALFARMSANTECGGPVVAIPRNMQDLALLAFSTGKDVRIVVTSSCDLQRRGVVMRIIVGSM